MPRNIFRHSMQIMKILEHVKNRNLRTKYGDHAYNEYQLLGQGLVWRLKVG
jgi:hypothetical protein